MDPAWLSPHRGPPDESKVTQKMKLTDGDSEILSMPVDTLLMNPWPNNEFIGTDVRHFLTEENAKLALVDSDDEDDIDQKPSIDFDDLLLTTSTTNSSTNSRHSGNPIVAGSHQVVNNSLAELKPLPPFTGYTSNITINGISGHHYHAIATAQNSARVLETNNNSVDTTNQNVPYYPTDHVVSSSTMDNTIDSIKSESNVLDYELPSDDLAALIGSAMADTTCATGDDSNESWLDLEYWISINCQNGSGTSPTSSRPSNNGTSHTINTNNSVLCQDTALPDFVTNSQFQTNQSPVVFHPHTKVPPAPTVQPSSQNHHSQAQHTQRQEHQREINTNFSHMPLLQNRLQNGPPKAEPQDIAYNIVSECPSPSSSTPYLAHSPPCHVVSTTDIGFIHQVHSSTRPSPELQVSFPHTTTPSKKSRSRNKSKMSSNIVYNEGNLGKEKTVHRCNICNRGFLNKSNIKVHLRTHTGEKPFRCDVCGKAFRQKAHLIKHAQIHKRVGRD